jgi:[histone H3]-lysine36 N-dimethyltransferase SETMAR
MASRKESLLKQRSVIEFLLKTGDNNALLIHKKLMEVYKDDCMDISNVRRWLRHFRSGETSIFDQSRSGRPKNVLTDQNFAKLGKMIIDNRSLTTYDIMQRLNCGKGSVLSMLDQLEVRKVCSKWVPKLLTKEMMNQRLSTCQDLLESFQNCSGDFFQGVVTGDETWIFYYDPYSKRESMEWHHKSSPVKKNPKLVGQL